MGDDNGGTRQNDHVADTVEHDKAGTAAVVDDDIGTIADTDDD